MRLARWNVALAAALATLLSLPAWGADTNTRRTAMPGTLNYVEGQASIGDQALDSKSVGQADLQDGQILSTGNGKAEVLLTPGVYLRVGSNSEVKMVSTSLANTQVAVDRGEAMLEVDRIYKENNIHVDQAGADTRIEKNGLYDFDAAGNLIRVFDGKAEVTSNDHNTTVKGGHELDLVADGKLKAHGFSKDQVRQDDDLYRWSSLRSEYLSEANVDSARLYYADGGWGPGWYGPGWYWNPWFAGFTYLPGDGFFYNPFGWGFYSPIMVYRAPFIVGGGYYHHFDGGRSVAIGRGFHGHAVRGFSSAHLGGFHTGGANAFHGARGGGGMHGGGGHR